MLKVVTIIGARPQIIKAAALSRAIRNKYADRIEEYIIHTGQHYDSNMSQVFIDELRVPAPALNLNIGSGSHGIQTALMIQGIEQALKERQPDYIILYGDTNSTLAGAVAACKLHIPIVHIEAGLRSYNKKMPEEINRLLCDHCSTLLFCPTETGFQNLIKENFNPLSAPPFSADNPLICNSGDLMYDNSLYFASIAERQSAILNKLNLAKNKYLLATIHRDNNTDIPERLNSIFKGLNSISIEKNIEIILPLHPRTAKLLPFNLDKDLYLIIQNNKRFKLTTPVSFLDMIMLEQNCKMVFTDSGGVQKEAYFFRKPSAILRSETEWIELVSNGASLITDADSSRIVDAYDHFSGLNSDLCNNTVKFPPIFGDGKAAEFICEKILKAGA